VYSLSSASIRDAVERAEKNDYYEKKLTQLSRASRKIGQSKKDLNYWIDYTFKVGTNHLALP